MIFVAHALDKPDALPRRLEALADHRAYLETAGDAHGVTVLMSGPMTTDDGEAMCGSFFLLRAEGRAGIEAMFAGDPMAKADVWADLSITRVAVRKNAVGDLGEDG